MIELIRPTSDQLAWQQLRIGMFFHFGVNTYFGQEWSDGSLPAAAVDPTELDMDDWMATATAAGARYVILTAKHHDGFCLWPTATTDYSIAASPWRGGGGDLVREFVDAARRADLLPGLYLSPWDRHASEYADPQAYSRLYCQQLEELCTGYGDLVEMWFDGAGSEGYEYDWPAIMAVVRRHQPRAMVFNMGDPTIRWVGNEDGLASDPVEYVVEQTKASNYTDQMDSLAGKAYLPPECDVSLRRGWFWAADDEPKSVEHLLEIHDRSVGLGANLLLNVPPMPNGRIDPADRDVVQRFGDEVRRRYGSGREVLMRPLGGGRWGGPLAGDGVVRRIWIEEDLADGQRVRSHRVLLDGVLVASGGTIGATRIHDIGACRGAELVIELVGDGPGLARVVVHG